MDDLREKIAGLARGVTCSGCMVTDADNSLEIADRILAIPEIAEALETRRAIAAFKKQINDAPAQSPHLD